MKDLEYFTFKVTKKGWHISYPEGTQKRHNIYKINNDIKNIVKTNSIYLLDENYKLGNIKDSFIFKRRMK